MPPADFNGKLLTPDWDRFAEILANSQVRVPMLADVGVASMINGPEGFTPDNEFCLGRPRSPGSSSPRGSARTGSRARAGSVT